MSNSKSNKNKAQKPDEIDIDTKIANFKYGSMEKALLEVDNQESITLLDAELRDLEPIVVMMDSHTKSLLRHMDDLIRPDNSNDRPKRLNTAEKKPKVSTLYVTSQVANLVTLKNLKLNMLKQRNELKGTAVDRALRVLAKIGDSKGGEGGDSLSKDQILEYLLKNITPAPTTNEESVVKTSKKEEKSADAEFEKVLKKTKTKRLDLRNEEASSKKTKKKKKTSKRKPTAILFIEEENKFYLVDSEKEVIDTLYEEDVELKELKDGSFVCSKHDLPIIL